MDGPTLHEALGAHGYRARKPTDSERAASAWGSLGKRAIVDRDGNVVGLMTAHEALDWLRTEHGHTDTCHLAGPCKEALL